MQDDEQIQSFRCPTSHPEQIHSQLIDELDSRAAARVMGNRPTIEQIQAVPCSTCGAKPGERCELHSGQPRTEPHRDRRLAAEDLLNS